MKRLMPLCLMSALFTTATTFIVRNGNVSRRGTAGVRWVRQNVRRVGRRWNGVWLRPWDTQLSGNGSRFLRARPLLRRCSRCQSPRWGLVFNLHSLEDFPGRYQTLSIGAALVRGESAATLKNEHGVRMQLETKMRGLRFNIAASRLTIILAGQQDCGAPKSTKR